MIHFYKYQGTGNDFIIIDNRKSIFNGSDYQLINTLCDRRFGIGADGLMLLEDHENYDFTMRYFNSDGKEASMCGNGGRCIAAFAVEQGILSEPDNFSFMAVDGLHHASYKNGVVSLKMIDVKSVNQQDTYFFLNTGSPHYVSFSDDLENLNLIDAGRKVRYSETFKPEGTNVNFVQLKNNDTIAVRTYERGVEDETYSCGTGVVASAIATHLKYGGATEYAIKVKGGELKVKFTKKDSEHFEDIWLTGAATFVFDGKI